MGDSLAPSYPIHAVKAVTRTTITCSHLTKERLTGYRHGLMTFDDVLNDLMERVSVNRVVQELAFQDDLRRLAVEAADLTTLRALLLQRLNEPVP